ncbi:MAG: hypothetical protein RLY35_2032 [Bacteroidota bacterium]|jgi:hypothetical protein
MRPLLTILLLCIFPICFLGQQDLKDWEGDWKGEMTGFNDGKVHFLVKTEMHIQPSTRCKNCWDWQTSYYGDTLSEKVGVVIKDYWMALDSTDGCNMTLHEPDQDGIDIHFQKMGSMIMGSYSISAYDELGNDNPEKQTIYYSQYELEGDVLTFDLSFFEYDLSKFGLDELNSNVGMLRPLGKQRSVLHRIINK